MDTLPTPLREISERHLAALQEAGAVPEDDRIATTLSRVVAASDFVAQAVAEREPGLLHDLADSGDLFTAYGETGHRQRLRALLDQTADEAGLYRALRRFRRREMVRIAYRSLAGWAGLEETLEETSDLAEASIDLTLDWLHRALAERWGTPRGPDGDPQHLVVLGMGKLGGRELNFSSDIDLIFAFPETGETDGNRPRSNDEFFVKLGRQLIGALSEITPDGQPYRVDMRLRPNGDAGPLALPFSAVETYYESQGREWERYAMIKARCVGGDYAAGDELTRSLRPFVYRRYLDYGALEQIREMKAMIAREVQRRGTARNIKTGLGGIREVEFVAQAFQLIRGGREPRLRSRRLMTTLETIAEQQLLPEHAVDELRSGYRFLRQAENAVQMLADEQSHTVPEDPVLRARVALGAGHLDADAFEAELEQVRRHTHDHFEQVFAAPQAEDSEDAEDPAELVWNGHLDTDEAGERLRALGFPDPEQLARRLERLREGAEVRALSARGRHRLDRLVPLVINACVRARRPELALTRVLDLIETVARRTAYLALLVEHPMALSQLVQLCDGSAWVARFLTAHPLLLDELLDPRTLYEPLGRDALEADLDTRLRRIAADDLEQQMEALRQFKQANQLKVAAADVSGAAPLMVVSDYLTQLAEVALERAVVVCREHLVHRHGRPMCTDGGERREAGFAVAGYGKLGGLELGYGSDLDLVFLHDSRGEAQHTDGERSVDNQVFFARLAQRVVHVLNTVTPGGIVYEVDTRLRPSGNAGLMSTTLDAFRQYQREGAWTWEHQALVRARAVAGDPGPRETFEQIRAEVLCQGRDTGSLRESVRSMRERQRKEKGSRKTGRFDLKNDRGGLTDIEFLVQFGVLNAAHDHPELTRYPDNIRLLRQLVQAGRLAEADANRLAGAYRAYRRRVHQLALQDQDAVLDSEELQDERAAVTAIWERIMEG
ncbi:bifunctional [glutamate--ammonia ligase]-adenylyl-L-tyrosine phosphorylase/[glutamate--ammonia-ligase] adenylyltransferase [Halorhodospira halophila]|uniref:Bifunctional glutamine synthetase adenylyltransferase/adenylyl-removing enzyme n=1 Tax=Halorhodospira halophila (strain DSM 244 / SL1) TaxID=349124 RepID=A1WZJ9_HALHL|nr:bifunctional [glutamate--ammonia ligase]-adenylyl-L-tyrosine phosphorylase/[glutamate--ammonia-ligase] adenylyltransferase [Halorhodospira halophila]ABM63111.1 (Glutamate--ammonia-ligase) adenylyltransferase [Halorhodospira halophila SL1]MBK1729289.1 bifunctional [glutamate--ammonia ligase]-adenylyl-L-tyrosine phosphorylase/[glutamate--ammonia-ligase] adenylyltransferase [Halorhodospira halophila]